MTQTAKKKSCLSTNGWIKSIWNHFWWCCGSCDGNEQLLREKRVSILSHFQNKHLWTGNMLFQKCCHPTSRKSMAKFFLLKLLLHCKISYWIKLYLAIWSISQAFPIQGVLKFTILHIITGYLKAHIFLTRGCLPVVKWLLLALIYVVSSHKQKPTEGKNFQYKERSTNF